VRLRTARAGLAVLCLVAAAGCQAGQLQFKNDHRLSFVSPQARHRVTMPLTISWTMKDFDAVGLDGSRGKDLRWVGHKDTSCKRDPRCPDAKYLADRGVLVTTETSVTLDVLPSAPDGAGDEQHYVNVVLLDGTGHRIGESAWYRPFTSKRRSSS